MENLIPFYIAGSFIAFAVTFAILFIVIICSDLAESGSFATVAIGAFLGIMYFWGDPTFFEIFTWRNVGIYLFAGKVFALVRTYFKGNELNKEEKKNYIQYDLRDNYLRWWFLFPISAINWVFGRLLRDLGLFVFSKMEKVIIAIFNA